MKTLLGEKARLVQRGYFAMVPRQRMEQFLQNALDDWTENDRVEEIDEYGSFNGFCTQRRILRVTVLFNQRQPTVEYRKRFLSLLIEKVEAMKWDVFEDVWLASSQCRQKQQPVENAGRTVSPSDQQTAEGYRTFFLDNDDTLQLTVRITHQPCIVSYGTTGLSTWDAGFYMVEWISRRPSVIRNKRVLELGAGSGLSGMCLLRLFSPSLYIFSDHHESVLSRLHDNLTLNELDQSPAVKVVELDWAATANEDVRELSVDVILAADVSYDPALFHPFFSTLNLLYTAASENALEIFIAMKRRSDDTYHHFHEVAKTHGWCLDDVTEPAATGRCFVSGSYMSDDCLMFKAQLALKDDSKNRLAIRLNLDYIYSNVDGRWKTTLSTKVSPDRLVVDVVAPEAEILCSNTRRAHCTLCGATFPDYGTFQVHGFLQHNNGHEANVQGTHQIDRPLACTDEIRYYCPVTDCRFSLQVPSASTQDASKGRGKATRYFKEMRYLKEHFLRQHGATPFKCDDCDLKCRSEEELRLHGTSCQPNVCACGKSIRTRAGFLRHIRNCSKRASDASAALGVKRPWSQHSSPPRIIPIQPKLPKILWIPVQAVKAVKTADILLINSCIQTTESLWRRPPRNTPLVSTGAQCVSYVAGGLVGKNCQHVQAGGDYCDLQSDIRSSAAQTNALLRKSFGGLQIDVYTQTDLLNDSDGFSTQEARALFRYLNTPEDERNCPGIQTQTIESELAPYYFPSSTAETQTFEDFYGGYDATSSQGVLSPGYATTETLGTQTSAYVDGLIDQFVQESVDMQTQTLEKLDSCFVWEFTDADTQTSSFQDFLRMPEY